MYLNHSFINVQEQLKLIALIFWALASMITYDTRILGGMFILSIIMFKVSKVKFKDISFDYYYFNIFTYK